MPSADSITFRPRDRPDFDDKDTACKSPAQRLPEHRSALPGELTLSPPLSLIHPATCWEAPKAHPAPPPAPLPCDWALRRGECAACPWNLGRGSNRSEQGCWGRPRSQAAGRGQAEVMSGREPGLEGQSWSGPGRAPRGKPSARTGRRARLAAPTLGTRRLCYPEWAPGPAPRRHLGQQAAEAWQGRPVAEAARGCLARARSLPAVTFTGCRGGAAARVQASAHLRRPQRKLPGPHAAQQTPGPRARQPRAPRAQHCPAKRSRRSRHLGPLQHGGRSRRPLRRHGNLKVARARERGAEGAGPGSVRQGPGPAWPRCSSCRGNRMLGGAPPCFPVVVTTPNYRFPRLGRLSPGLGGAVMRPPCRGGFSRSGPHGMSEVMERFRPAACPDLGVLAKRILLLWVSGQTGLLEQ